MVFVVAKNRKRQRENRKLRRIECNEIAQTLGVDIHIVEEISKTKPESLRYSVAELKGYSNSCSRIYEGNTGLKSKLPGSYGSAFK